MYKPKNKILKSYLENNEAKSAKIGKDEILISVEDVDEVISRVIQNYPTRKVRVSRPTSKIIHESGEFSSVDITSCCKVGPIVNENYCPKCGNKLIR